MEAPRELAQVNVSIARAPLDDPTMRGFVSAFARTADLAEHSPGHVWHLRPAPGEETVSRDGRLLVVNVSVWRDHASLHDFVYRSSHGQLLSRGRRWFHPSTQPSTALWWVEAGTRPTTGEGLDRLEHLRAHGPSPTAFSLRRQFDAEGKELPRSAQPVS
jgi:hypothetical protein